MAFDRNIPLIGFHTRIAEHEAVNGLIKLIEQGLAPLGFNTLILEFNPGYAWRCFPEFSNGSFGADDAEAVREVCQRHGIRPVPLFQCLSHQSDFGAVPWPLYRAHPELLETPDVPADAVWPDIYCHSWCASNDAVYDYVFPMIDELIDAFGAEAVHIGIDEVFEIGEDCCPRCRGKNRAKLLARTIRILHDHLAGKQVETMMWGDRLLDAEKLGYQMWEADKFGMHPAFDLSDQVTRDIMICDWHYDLHDHGYPSIDQFMRGGFFTVPAIAADLEQAKHFWGHCLEAIYLGRKFKWSGKLGGIICTHWSPLTQTGADELLRGIRGEAIDRSKPFGSGLTGEVIGQMIPSARQFRKKY